MDCLLLAAGLGQRLRPLTEKKPKVLMPINGIPLLSLLLSILNTELVSNVYINTHHLHKQIEDYVAGTQFSNIKLIYEKEILGTAGTIWANRHLFKSTFLVMHADNLTFFNLNDFFDAHHRRPIGCLMTMMTFESDSPESCGIVEIDDNGVVMGFYEKVKKPPSTLANAAVYIVEPKIFDLFDNINSPIDFSNDVLPKLLGKIYTYHNYQYHRDIGTPESYEQAQNDYKSFLGKFFTS